MLASCFILVGLSYYLLNLFSGMVAAPRTPVEEREEGGELLLPLEEELTWMESSLDGRYLAAVSPGDAGSGRLMILDLEDAGRKVWSKEISGDRAHWVGSSLILVFEDGGDIFSLDLGQEPPGLVNLTGGPEYEKDPLPSPDGRYVLYAASTRDGEGSEFRVMDLESGETLTLGAGKEPVAWDPTGIRLVCLASLDGAEEGDACIIQEADTRSGTWTERYHCEEEVRYLWWPELGGFYYLAPYRQGERTRAVWFEVRPTGKGEKRASTDGLGADFSGSIFRPMRGGPLLAYPGVTGLEIMDIRLRRIIRFTRAGTADAVLAWREDAGELLWWEPGGIYRLWVR